MTQAEIIGERVRESEKSEDGTKGLYRISIHISREDMAKLKSKAYGVGFKSMSECIRRMVSDFIK